MQEDREVISAEEGSETVDTDEYLQPKNQRVSPATTVSPESPTPQNQTNWDREMMRYATSDHPHTHHPTRYCSEPLHKGIVNRFNNTDSFI